MAEQSTSARADRLIGCRDFAGRRRTVIVFGDQLGVILIAPAGETAVLSPAEVTNLHTALDQAVEDHQHHRDGG